MASFSFSFSGDDIEEESASTERNTTTKLVSPSSAESSAGTASASAFPVQGKPQLPPQRHDIRDMLAKLPSKISYGLLDVRLEEDDGSSSAAHFSIQLPRRELWDVRLQLMAEEEDEDGGEKAAGGELVPGLGSHDVKTGIYEGGFKSWESSVDLVKVLLRPSPTPTLDDGLPATGTSRSVPSAVAAGILLGGNPAHVIELGCGTALPSLALFQWACANTSSSQPLAITVADYNPSVLYLVTLPNFLLTWALELRQSSHVLQQAFADDEEGGGGADESGGELELTDDVKTAFCEFLQARGISLTFLSGGWSSEFTALLPQAAADTLVLGAETIYSPFALQAFSETVLAILRRTEKAVSATDSGETSTTAARKATRATAVVGAKKLYFGVGGSLDDFVRGMRVAGVTVTELREEADGVRRGVVQVSS